MLVLTVDTATAAVTAGLVELLGPHEIAAGADGAAPLRVLAEHSVDDAFAHAERLLPLARAALSDAARGFPDIDAVVVGLGPGPFTGLRVGIATAAALGDALDVPVHGVPSHDAMARVVAASTPDLAVVTDARRREVYVSAYDSRGRRLLGPLVVSPAALPAVLAEDSVRPRTLTGAGAGLVAGVLDLPVAEQERPLSAGLVECAAVALLTGAVPGPLRPLYLRRPDATVPAARRSVFPRGDSE